MVFHSLSEGHVHHVPQISQPDNSRRRVFIMDELFHDFEMYRSIQMSIKEQDYSYNPEGYVFCQDRRRPVNISKMIPNAAGSGARRAAVISRLCSSLLNTRISVLVAFGRRMSSIKFSMDREKRSDSRKRRMPKPIWKH